MTERPSPAATEVAMLSDKMHRFGLLGAGVIFDPMTAIKLAEARSEEPAAVAADVKPLTEPGAPPTALAPAAPGIRSFIPEGPGGKLSRQQILEILAETVRVQGLVQQEISALARKLAKERADKKKKKSLSFVDGHKKILELNLPREPLEDFGMSEASFQGLLSQYEDDGEVMASAQQLLHPAGKGDAASARAITMDKIVEIHQFMVMEMQKVLHEFLQLPQEVRRTFTGKGCETTAELLVSIAVEQQLAVRCEDVEQAVMAHEEQLAENAEFTRCTEQLAGMMQHLIGAAQPRVQKAEFLQMLRHMSESTRKAKAFAKKLYEDYRAKSCGISEAYRRFEDFAQSQAPEGEELPDLSTVEMRLCFDEYREDSEVMAAWEQAGVDNNPMMQAMLSGCSRASSSTFPSGEDRKGEKCEKGKKQLKSSEIVEMQELMVDELKRTVDAAASALADVGEPSPWRAEIAVQMVQALASAAVERRYGVAAEEMTMAGFQHAPVLQKNERFVRSTEKQQELLMKVAQLCGHQG